MSESRLERVLTFRLALAYDCWGNRRPVHAATQGHLWSIAARDFDTPVAIDHHGDHRQHRLAVLDELIASGVLTTTEARTLHALVVECATLHEIAERDGCSRQAVIARLVGNSKGQGGAISKVQRWLLARGQHDGCVPSRPPHDQENRAGSSLK